MATRKAKYKSAFNGQISYLDSSYEINYAIYLDELLKDKKIVGWVKNTTKFALNKPAKYHTSKGEIKEQFGVIPDFIVFMPSGKYKIVETKGWVDSDKNSSILARAKESFKNLNYEVISKPEIIKIQKSLKLKYGGALPFGWIVIK